MGSPESYTVCLLHSPGGPQQSWNEYRPCCSALRCDTTLTFEGRLIGELSVSVMAVTTFPQIFDRCELPPLSSMSDLHMFGIEDLPVWHLTTVVVA